MPLSSRYAHWASRLLGIGAALFVGAAVAALHTTAHAAAMSAPIATKYEPHKRAPVEIRVVERGWGKVRAQDIETVLYSVAGILLENFPGRRLYPIIVSHSPERPITLHKRGPGNAYQIQLSAKGQHWGRYAYEFAHELSHILMKYDHHPDQTVAFNQWFEEALCEAASLYALKRLAFVWEFWPPEPRWAAYAPEFERYVERFLSETHRRLPPDVSLNLWFSKHEQTLRGSAYLRNHNEVLANVLLPLFEENDEFWEAIAYLNVQRRGSSTFREYLQAWHESAPEDYRDTIRYIMVLLGVQEAGQ